MYINIAKLGLEILDKTIFPLFSFCQTSITSDAHRDLN